MENQEIKASFGIEGSEEIQSSLTEEFEDHLSKNLPLNFPYSSIQDFKEQEFEHYEFMRIGFLHGRVLVKQKYEKVLLEGQDLLNKSWMMIQQYIKANAALLRTQLYFVLGFGTIAVLMIFKVYEWIAAPINFVFWAIMIDSFLSFLKKRKNEKNKKTKSILKVK